MANPSPKRSAKRIPSLDGLRALSIALVLVGHLNGTRGFPFSGSALINFIDLGNVGVRVFFVISGFLITGLLLGEIEKHGNISIPHFYFRRVLRIFPAYYALILCVWLGTVVGLTKLDHGDLFAALTYTMNYHTTHAWDLGHAWSLAVEEQFYLLWPAALWLTGARRGMWIAVAAMIVIPFVRIALLIPPGGAPGMGFRFETVADSLAAGCLLAGLRSQLWDRQAYRVFLQSRRFLAVPIGIVAVFTLPTLAGHNTFHLEPMYTGIYNLVGITATNIGIAVCIDWVVRNADGAVGQVLNWTPVAFVGTLSYSLYLWQQIFLNRNSSVWWNQFPQNIALVAVAALLSYYAVERPALRFRQRLERLWRHDGIRSVGRELKVN